MSPPDDIRTDAPASESGGTPPPATPAPRPRRRVGPESETRGGSEAPDQGLPETQPPKDRD